MREEGAGYSPRHKPFAAFVSECDHCRHLDSGLDFDFRKDWRMAVPELRKQVLTLKRSEPVPIETGPPRLRFCHARLIRALR